MRRLTIELDLDLLRKLMLLPDDIRIEAITPAWYLGTRKVVVVLSSESNAVVPEVGTDGSYSEGYLDYAVDEDWIELDRILVKEPENEP